MTLSVKRLSTGVDTVRYAWRGIMRGILTVILALLIDCGPDDREARVRYRQPSSYLKPRAKGPRKDEALNHLKTSNANASTSKKKRG